MWQPLVLHLATRVASPTVLQNQLSAYENLFLGAEEQDVQDASIGAGAKTCVLRRSSREDCSVYTYVTPITPMMIPFPCPTNTYMCHLFPAIPNPRIGYIWTPFPYSPQPPNHTFTDCVLFCVRVVRADWFSLGNIMKYEITHTSIWLALGSVFNSRQFLLGHSILLGLQNLPSLCKRWAAAAASSSRQQLAAASIQVAPQKKRMESWRTKSCQNRRRRLGSAKRPGGRRGEKPKPAGTGWWKKASLNPGQCLRFT